MAIVMDVDPEEVTPQEVKYMCSEKNPAHGRLVSLKASDTTTTKNKPFTRCDWKSVPKEIQNQSDELRAKAGFPPF
jgi:hypothetical protein